MTLTPPRFHIADEMPMSLGKAIARAIAPKLCEERAFETGDYRYLSGLPAHPKLQAAYIDEANSQQIKGAAQTSESARAETPRTPVASPPSQKFKVGDRVQWTAQTMRDNHFTSDMNESWVISRLDGSKAYDSAGQYDDIKNLELIPSPDAEADGWIEFDGRRQLPPKGWGEDYFDLRGMSMGKPFEHLGQVYGQRGNDTFYVTAYRRTVKP